ncbi:MAG TPA: hypothetical protein DCZ95_07605 [Verrucomicrobia bacterium]|nr:MAG: hypothetical protein A2X46_01205 [Lentisphaerae bacterium GWF2_57_35]HBA83940.1 hypothetical protein [Verrucomicrobiota bacterium]
MEGRSPAGFLMRRPMLGIALAGILGTGLGLWAPFSAEALLAWSVLLLLSLLAFLSRPFSNALVFALIGVVSCLNAHLSAWNPSERELSRLMEENAEYVSIVGWVADDPQYREGRDEKVVVCTWPLSLEGILRTESWQKVSGQVEVRVLLPAGAHRPAFGERWLLRGLLQQQTGNREGPFGYRYRMEPSAAFASRLSAGRGPGWISWCFRRRENCRDILGQGLKAYPEQAGLLSALMLGYRQDLPAQRYRDFSVTGTMHIFAISGTHVGVLAVFIIVLLKSLGSSRPHWILYLAPLLGIFTVATGMSSSAVRACIMAVLFWSSGLFERKPDALSALAFSALLILAAAPMQLVDPGFILSFTAVAGLILVYPPLARPLRDWTKKDDWQLAPESVWKTRLRSAAGSLVALTAASWAAWLVTTPLTAIYFNLFSPVALLANIVVIPAAGLVMLTGCLSMIVGSVSSLGAEVFNHANRVFILVLLWFIDRAAAVPGGHFFVPAPPAWATTLWYLGLAAGAAGFPVRRWSMAIGVSLCLALAGLWFVRSGRDVRVDLLDVGQGNAALVNVPGRDDLLLDTGSKFYARRVLQHLRRQGVSRLRVLALSHADAEHIGGALEIMASIPVEEIWCAPFLGRSPAYRQILNEARRQGIRIRRMTRGQKGSLSGGVEWEILDPPDLPSARVADEACLAIRFARDAASVLFMSDAGPAAESRIMESDLEPTALVLVVGGHGAPASTLDAWLEAVSPESAVISVGSDNVSGCPDKELLARLSKRNIQVYRTDEQGSIRIRFVPGAAVEIKPLAPP